MRILNRKEEAEDALQESFTTIFEKLDTFRHDSSFGASAKRIVVNLSINNLNKNCCVYSNINELANLLKEDKLSIKHLTNNELIKYNSHTKGIEILKHYDSYS